MDKAWVMSNKTCFLFSSVIEPSAVIVREASTERLKCNPTLYKPETFGNAAEGSRMSRNELGVLRKRWRNVFNGITEGFQQSKVWKAPGCRVEVPLDRL